MFPTSALSESIGKRLLAARVARGLSVEDVSFKTRIPASKVSELENDDFSNFANLTYAKGFLKLYSNFLDLDIGSYLDQFNTSEFANISGHDYIQSANTGMTGLSMAVAPKNEDGRGKSLFVIILVLAAMIGLPIWYWNHGGHDEEKPLQPAPQQGPIPKAKPYVEPSTEPAPKTGTLPEEPTSPAPVSKPEIRPAGIRAKVIPEDPPEPPTPKASAANDTINNTSVVASQMNVVQPTDATIWHTPVSM